MRTTTFVTILFVCGSSAAFAEELPRLDIEATCRAAPRLLPQDPAPYDACMKDEHEARAQLALQWATLNPEHRRNCEAQTKIEGSPSYVDVLTCIQMYAGR